jgi:cytochrome o ubiquinol oxidase subunit 3
MSQLTAISITKAEFKRREEDSKSILGFWIYLMTDCVLFASLFATFIVLRNNTFDGPGGNEIFSMPYVFAETVILLTSSFTAGLAMLALHAKDNSKLLIWLSVTFVLGLAFLGMELNEFSNLYNEGNSWRRSGFLTAFFTLVGTHGLHITSGLIWLAVLMAKIYKHGIKGPMVKRLTMFSLFWHFLDIVWIFIFTIVFLMGAS